MPYAIVECIGPVYLDKTEAKLLKTQPLRTLRRKDQLSFCNTLNLNINFDTKEPTLMDDIHPITDPFGGGGEYLGSPSINYDRLTHSLQVFYLTRKNLEYNRISPEIAARIRVAALCHDLHHTAKSHTLEKDGKVTPEQRAEELILKTEIADVLRDGGISPEKVLDIVLHRKKGYEWDIINFDVGTDRMGYYMMDTKRYFDKFNREDCLNTLPRSISNVDEEACILLGFSLMDLEKEPQILRALWNLLKGRSRLFALLYGSLYNRAGATLLRNAVQMGLEEGVITDIDLYKLYDIQLSSKLQQEGSKEIKFLMEKLETEKLPSVKLDVSLKKELPYITRLKENREERLKIEQEIGENVYIDINPLGGPPEGDTKVLANGREIVLKDALKSKYSGFDIAEVRRAHEILVNNRLMIFGFDQDYLEKRAMKVLGLDENQLVDKLQRYELLTFLTSSV